MKIDRKERFMIANQLRILEALYPNEADYYARNRVIFEEGYEGNYEWAMENINRTPLSSELSEEIINVLDMYRALYYFKRDNDCSDLNEYSLQFRGYDGNDEVEYKMMSYARFFVVEMGRFQEIIEEHGDFFDFNSHGAMRSKYLRMLEKWSEIPPGRSEGQRHNLTKSQVQAIVEA